MRPGVREAERLQQGLGLGRRDGVDAELHEGEAVEPRAVRQHGAAELVLEHEQRAHGVDRRAVRISLAEDVVEDLQRQRPRVARVQHARDELRQRERALAGEAAVVAAPLQHVHHQPRRVGELQEEDPFSGDLGEPRQVAPDRQDVKGVQAGPERGMVGGRDDVPGVRVVVDVPAPGERLIGHAQPALPRTRREQVQVLGGQRVVVDRRGRDVRADQHGRRAELLHHVELGLRPAQVGLRDGLEVAERLVEVDREAERLGPRTHGGGGERRVDEVGLEELDAVEARGRRGGQLLLERAAQAHGRDRASHQRAPPTGAAVSSAKWRSIRARSGSTPVNSSKDPAAWKTAIPPPSSVRQPSSPARWSSGVSSGR